MVGAWRIELKFIAEFNNSTKKNLLLKRRNITICVTSSPEFNFHYPFGETIEKISFHNYFLSSTEKRTNFICFSLKVLNFIGSLIKFLYFVSLVFLSNNGSNISEDEYYSNYESLHLLLNLIFDFSFFLFYFILIT